MDNNIEVFVSGAPAGGFQTYPGRYGFAGGVDTNHSKENILAEGTQLADGRYAYYYIRYDFRTSGVSGRRGSNFGIWIVTNVGGGIEVNSKESLFQLFSEAFEVFIKHGVIGQDASGYFFYDDRLEAKGEKIQLILKALKNNLLTNSKIHYANSDTASLLGSIRPDDVTVGQVDATKIPPPVPSVSAGYKPPRPKTTAEIEAERKKQEEYEQHLLKQQEQQLKIYQRRKRRRRFALASTMVLFLGLMGTAFVYQDEVGNWLKANFANEQGGGELAYNSGVGDTPLDETKTQSTEDGASTDEADESDGAAEDFADDEVGAATLESSSDNDSGGRQNSERPSQNTEIIKEAKPPTTTETPNGEVADDGTSPGTMPIDSPDVAVTTEVVTEDSLSDQTTPEEEAPVVEETPTPAPVKVYKPEDFQFADGTVFFVFVRPDGPSPEIRLNIEKFVSQYDYVRDYNDFEAKMIMELKRYDFFNTIFKGHPVETWRETYYLGRLNQSNVKSLKAVFRSLRGEYAYAKSDTIFTGKLKEKGLISLLIYQVHDWKTFMD